MTSSSDPVIGRLEVAGPVAVDPMVGLDISESGWRRAWGHVFPGIQLARLAVIAAMLGIWQLAVKQEWINPIYAATPGETFSALWDLLQTGEFWSDLVVTLREAVIAFVVGGVFGLVVGVILGRWITGSKIFLPVLTFINAVPKIALAPIFILWFGIGEESKVVTAAIVVFFIVQVPTTAAVALTNPDLDTVATTMGANEWQKFWRVYLPGILAAVFGALRLAAVFSLLTVVFAEFLAAEKGLGQRLIAATNQFRMDEAFAIMFVLAVLTLILNGVLGLAERHFLRWQSSEITGSVVSM